MALIICYEQEGMGGKTWKVESVMMAKNFLKSLGLKPTYDKSIFPRYEINFKSDDEEYPKLFKYDEYLCKICSKEMITHNIAYVKYVF